MRQVPCWVSSSSRFARNDGPPRWASVRKVSQLRPRPIVDARDRVVAALCISAPTTRLSEDGFAELRRPLESCAAEIQALLKSG